MTFKVGDRVKRVRGGNEGWAATLVRSNSPSSLIADYWLVTDITTETGDKAHYNDSDWDSANFDFVEETAVELSEATKEIQVGDLVTLSAGYETGSQFPEQQATVTEINLEGTRARLNSATTVDDHPFTGWWFDLSRMTKVEATTSDGPFIVGERVWLKETMKDGRRFEAQAAIVRELGDRVWNTHLINLGGVVDINKNQYEPDNWWFDLTSVEKAGVEPVSHTTSTTDDLLTRVLKAEAALVEFKTSIRQALIDEGTSRDWCGELDEFLEANDLEPRARAKNYDVSVTLSFLMTEQDEEPGHDAIKAHIYDMNRNEIDYAINSTDVEEDE